MSLVASGVKQASSNRVRRGGSFNNAASNLRAAYRNNNTPTTHNNNNGFRCAKTRETSFLPGRPEEDGSRLGFAWRSLVQPALPRALVHVGQMRT
jgi:hypothetical protein